MYKDDDLERVLLRSGKSIVSPKQFTELLINGVDVTGVVVIESRDSLLYDYINGTNITSTAEDIFPEPPERVQFDVDEVLSFMTSLPRFVDSVENRKRLKTELAFFNASGNMEFVFKLVELIERFKEDGVLWGVGRGSSCASYVMYLIEVNDVNPMEYGIPFSEMSKQEESEYEVSTNEE